MRIFCGSHFLFIYLHHVKQQKYKDMLLIYFISAIILFYIGMEGDVHITIGDIDINVMYLSLIPFFNTIILILYLFFNNDDNSNKLNF